MIGERGNHGWHFGDPCNKADSNDFEMHAVNIATPASLRKSLLGWFGRGDIDCLQVCDPFRVQQLIRPSEQQHQLITTLTPRTLGIRNGTLLFWPVGKNPSPISVPPCDEGTNRVHSLSLNKRLHVSSRGTVRPSTFPFSPQMQTRLLMISRLEVVTERSCQVKGVREQPNELMDFFSLNDLRFYSCEAVAAVMRKVNMSGCRVEYL